MMDPSIKILLLDDDPTSAEIIKMAIMIVPGVKIAEDVNDTRKLVPI